ncbi:hypothetical protein MRX96_007714 [Rhipicephalus microplus]
MNLCGQLCAHTFPSRVIGGDAGLKFRKSCYNSHLLGPQFLDDGFSIQYVTKQSKSKVLSLLLNGSSNDMIITTLYNPSCTHIHFDPTTDEVKWFASFRLTI